jgi:hypothetical protein
MADDGKKPLVFISHKHQDVDIAKALASWLQVATRNGVEVFQSSDGFKDGPSLGRSLTEEIRSRAHEAAAMFVLYTDAEQDWEWVMFEVGIGLDPSTPETRVVLVQCGPESPHVLRERMRVDVRDANSCIRFAKELLTTSFFDGFPPLADFETTFIERVAAQLQKDLEPILPKDVANANWSPHPRLRLRVQHRDGEQVDADFVRIRGKVVSDADNRIANEIFDLQTVVEQSLDDLVARNPAVTELVNLIVSAMEHQLSSSAKIVTFTGKRDRYSAILTEVRRRPFQRATVFDLSLIRQE